MVANRTLRVLHSIFSSRIILNLRKSNQDSDDDTLLCTGIQQSYEWSTNPLSGLWYCTTSGLDDEREPRWPWFNRWSRRSRSIGLTHNLNITVNIEWWISLGTLFEYRVTDLLLLHSFDAEDVNALVTISELDVYSIHCLLALILDTSWMSCPENLPLSSLYDYHEVCHLVKMSDWKQ